MIKQELREEDIQLEELYRNEMVVTLGQMAKGMIHEFNNPLQAIKLIAQSTNRFQRKNPPETRFGKETVCSSL